MSELCGILLFAVKSVSCFVSERDVISETRVCVCVEARRIIASYGTAPIRSVTGRPARETYATQHLSDTCLPPPAECDTSAGAVGIQANNDTHTSAGWHVCVCVDNMAVFVSRSLSKSV